MNQIFLEVKKQITNYMSLLLLLIFAHSACSQELTQTLRGTVADKDSKIPLEGANVMLLNTYPSMGSSTDQDGQFRIENVPLGRYSIKVSYIGYEEVIIPEVNVSSGKEAVMNIELKEYASSLDEVVIVARTSKDKPVNSMAAVSARSFGIDEASRYAGSFSDPGRMASAFAGVVSNNSFSNEITIRGNAPTGLLWRLEGIEIPTPNHLSGYASNGGVVTVLSTNVMANSDFMTGAFSPEYGNATSGVFDIRLRNGNEERHEFALQASLFGLEAAAEGPFKKGSRGSYLVNYRYATTSLLGNTGLLDKSDGLPTWQDLSFKVNLPTKAFGEFELFGIGGLSEVNETAERDSANWENQFDSQDSKFQSNMGVTGISHRIFSGNNTYFKTVLAVSARETIGSSDSLDTNYEKYFNGRSETRDFSTSLSALVNHKFGSKNVIRSGVILDHKSFNVFARDISPVYPYDMQTLVDSKGDYYSFQYYIQWKNRISNTLELNAGLHAFYNDFNTYGKIEPRAAIKWDLKEDQSLSLGYGVHSRMAPASIYFEEIEVGGIAGRPNMNLELGRSDQYVLSYDRNFGREIRLKLEAYYQSQKNVPIEDNQNSTFSLLNNISPVTGLVLANKGTGTNKGIELTLEKFFSKDYYFLLTGSVYDSKYVGGDGVERNTRFNGNFVGNFLVGKEFLLNRGKAIGVDLRFVLAGGNRVTPVDLEQSRLEGTTVYVDELAFSEQAPAYFRPDLKLSYTRNKGGMKSILSLDVQNVSNQQNLLTTYYDTRKNEVVKKYQFGILPNISYRLQF